MFVLNMWGLSYLEEVTRFVGEFLSHLDVIEANFIWNFRTDAPVNFEGFTHVILANKNTMLYVNKEKLKKLANMDIPFYSEQIIIEYLLCMPPESALTKYHALHAEFHKKWNIWSKIIITGNTTVL